MQEDRSEQLAASPFDVEAYAGELQRAARHLTQTGPGSWREVVNRGLSEAYAQRDAIGLSSMVQVIVGFLDADGRLQEAVAEIEHAVSLAGGDSAATAMLHAMKASYLAATGATEAARAAIQAAATVRASTNNQAAIAKSRALTACVGLTLLDAGELATLDDLMGMQSTEVPEGDALYLMSLYVPYRFATGDRTAAHPWIRNLRLAAERAGHEYRLADARTFEAAEATIAEPAQTPQIEGISSWNWLGRWRVQTLRLRSALLLRDAASAERELGLLLRARRRAGDARLDEIDAFEALYRTFAAGDGQPLALPRPNSVHLLNIASILAGAEAVAFAGSQAEAAAWFDWMRHSVPERVQTALEWPVSRLRLQGLVALRAGDHRGARRSLELALEWTESAGYPIEHALTLVQLAEYLDQYSGASSERALRAMREQGWRTLRAAGIDAAPHAYVVARSRAVAKEHLALSPLTRREAEVLALLAEGLTYKAIAGKLGIAWPTVQALAHRCYDKLDASGRVNAVQAAKDLGIL